MSYTIRDTPTLAEQQPVLALDVRPEPAATEEPVALYVTLPGHVETMEITITAPDPKKTTAPAGATKEETKR